jgi:hypothetical protein
MSIDERLSFMTNKAIKLEQALMRRDKEVNQLHTIIREAHAAMENEEDSTAFAILTAALAKEDK